MLEVKINENDAGIRLDKYLQKTFPKLGKSAMYKAIRNKKIKVNRKRAAFDQKLASGDSLLLFLPPDLLEMKSVEVQDSKPVDIVYEDENLLIVRKPAGLLSQKDQPGRQDTLNDRILSYLVKSGQYNPNEETSFVPAICHRLDRNTSGLVIAAKNAAMLRQVNEAIRDHKLKKTYRAVVEGVPEEGPVRLYLKKEGTKALVSRTEKPGFKEADMNIRVIEAGKECSVIEVDLISGRFHQIRACMAFLNHPLAGDIKYGSRQKKNSYDLCACRLDFSDSDIHTNVNPIILKS